MPDSGAISRPVPAALSGHHHELPPGHRRRLLIRWALLILGPLALLVGAAEWYLQGGRYVSTDNAYVRADMVNIATDVSGIVAETMVHENQPVTAGQVLFRLDDEPFRIALTQADAQLRQVRDDIEVMRATYRQRQEDIKRADADVVFFQREQQRQSDLVQHNFVSRSQFDRAQHDLDTARQQASMLRQQLAATIADLAGNPEIPTEQHPRYLAALAQRDQAARNLRQATVRAPMAGVVTNVDQLKPGEYLAAGQTAYSLVATDHVWIVANPKETDLTYVEPGNPATISVDSYPGRRWQGAVASLSPASNAEFSLLPAQNTTGNWVKVVQRIPVRVRVDTAKGQPPLRVGMSVTVDIDTGRRRSLSTLIGSAFGHE
jgi:membrane fusion protein, multidrug efflux system